LKGEKGLLFQKRKGETAYHDMNLYGRDLFNTSKEGKKGISILH